METENKNEYVSEDQECLRLYTNGTDAPGSPQIGHLHDGVFFILRKYLLFFLSHLSLIIPARLK